MSVFLRSMRGFALLSLVALITVSQDASATANGDNDYGAPFSDVGATDSAAQPAFTPAISPPVVATGTAPNLQGTTAKNYHTPPRGSTPDSVDIAAKATQTGLELCQQFMPDMYIGYTEYATKYGITEAAVNFAPNQQLVTIDSLKRCWDMGHRPPEVNWATASPHVIAEMCCALYPSVPDNFYTEMVPRGPAPIDNGSSQLMYFYSQVTPRQLSVCLGPDSTSPPPSPYYVSIPTQSQYNSGVRCQNTSDIAAANVGMP